MLKNPYIPLNIPLNIPQNIPPNCARRTKSKTPNSERTKTNPDKKKMENTLIALLENPSTTQQDVENHVNTNVISFEEYVNVLEKFPFVEISKRFDLGRNKREFLQKIVNDICKDMSALDHMNVVARVTRCIIFSYGFYEKYLNANLVQALDTSNEEHVQVGFGYALKHRMMYWLTSISFPLYHARSFSIHKLNTKLPLKQFKQQHDISKCVNRELCSFDFTDITINSLIDMKLGIKFNMNVVENMIGKCSPEIITTVAQKGMFNFPKKLFIRMCLYHSSRMLKAILRVSAFRKKSIFNSFDQDEKDAIRAVSIEITEKDILVETAKRKLPEDIVKIMNKRLKRCAKKEN